MAKLNAGRLCARSATLPAVLGRHGLHDRERDLAHVSRRRLTSIGGGADEIMLGIICKGMGTLPGQRKNH